MKEYQVQCLRNGRWLRARNTRMTATLAEAEDILKYVTDWDKKTGYIAEAYRIASREVPEWTEERVVLVL